MLALLAAASLGSAHFTASGPPECRRKVLEGVLYLHSFMYDDARESFQAAMKAQPCPIAYWGEAMTYDHPIWDESEPVSGRAALSMIPEDAKLSPLERGLVEAARALYAGGRGAWMERLQRLNQQLPADDEVSLFYALSLYANSEAGKNVKRAMEAAAIALDVFQRNPDHPGAAHYLIHACDSPDHAVLALRAAEKYAQIAPAASHALHMPSHIFVQLGMWSEAEKSNVAAFAASQEWVKRKDLPPTKADWHSYYWLAEARLELGRAPQALQMAADVEKLGDPKLRWVTNMLRLMVLESTKEWARVDEILGPPREPDYGEHTEMFAVMARLDAAAASGDVEAAEKYGRQLTSFRMGHFAEYAAVIAPARIAQAKSVRDTGSINQAIELMRKLADKEDDGSQGPAIHTPAREELGDLLLRSHRFVEAEKEFRTALAVRPNRRNALRGLAEAARGADDLRTADEAQAKLAAQGR